MWYRRVISPDGSSSFAPTWMRLPADERLAVVVAEEEVDPEAPRRVPQLRRERRVLVEQEGHGGLGPDDEAGARAGGPLGELEVPAHVRRGVLGHPLVLLAHAALDEADRDPAGLGHRLTHLPAAPAPGRAHPEGRRGEGHAPGPRARLRGRVREQGRPRADEEGDPVHRRERGRLGEGEEGVLAVAEEHPREREEGVGAGVLEAGPEEGRAEEPGRPERRDEAPHSPPEQGVEDGEGQAESDHDQEAHREGKPPVLDDDERRPVEEAHRGHRPRHVAEPGRAPARGPGEGHEERGEGHPGDGPVAELRERQEEEQARERGQALPAPGAQRAPPAR